MDALGDLGGDSEAFFLSCNDDNNHVWKTHTSVQNAGVLTRKHIHNTYVYPEKSWGDG